MASDKDAGNVRRTMQKYTPTGPCNLKCGKCMWTNGCYRKDLKGKMKKGVQ